MGKIADRFAKRNFTIRAIMPEDDYPEGAVVTEDGVAVVCKVKEVYNMVNMCLQNHFTMCIDRADLDNKGFRDAFDKALTDYDTMVNMGLVAAPPEDHTLFYARTSNGTKVAVGGRCSAEA